VESIEPVNATSVTVTLRFERALASGPLTLEAEAPYKVDGLLLRDIVPINDDAQSITADIEALSGVKAAWFGPLDGDPVFTYGDATRQFPLGSTFKLYVLAAASRAVGEGRLAWDDVLILDAKSFPSGIMQNWPDGAPVTLQTAATLMISISDNTATDLVLRAVGREAVEAEMRMSGHAHPEKSFPFLTTREMFVLKASEQGEAYARADQARRRAILASLDSNEVNEKRVLEVFSSGSPVLIEDIEWYASMQDERRLMRVLAEMPGDTAREIMAVTTSLTDAEEAEWSYVGYKGGSEPGVLNLSWLLRDDAGQWHMLAVSHMDPTSEVDTSTLMMIAKRILALAE
jgi:beta-lactamase class A